jgi:hypothetical protein
MVGGGPPFSVRPAGRAGASLTFLQVPWPSSRTKRGGGGGVIYFPLRLVRGGRLVRVGETERSNYEAPRPAPAGQLP